MAKKITLVVLVVTVLVGLFLLFTGKNMDRYLVFVRAIAILYTPLIASIGINSGIEKYKGSEEEKEKKCVGENQELV